MTKIFLLHVLYSFGAHGRKKIYSYSFDYPLCGVEMLENCQYFLSTKTLISGHILEAATKRHLSIPCRLVGFWIYSSQYSSLKKSFYKDMFFRKVLSSAVHGF
jgi:hypothetical protein